MIVNTALLIKGVKAEYEKAAREMNIARNLMYKDLFTVAPSTAAYENYAWLGNLPQLREWKGRKSAKSLKDNKYQIINKDWEGTLEVDRNEVEDDQLSAIRPRCMFLSQQAVKFPHILVSNLIKNGDSGLAYDGVSFYNAVARTGQTFANSLTGTGVTDAQFAADLQASRAAMMSFLDDYGEPMGLIGDTVVVPPSLEGVARRVIRSTTTAGQANPDVINPWEGQIDKIIVDPRLTDVNDWYLNASTYPLRPFIYQDRKAPVFVALDKPDSPNVFFWRKIYFGVEMRGNAGYGFWQMSVKTVNA